MSRTDHYIATISHCRGGAISTWAEQTVTLLIFLIAGAVRSLHKQNRLLHFYYFSLQGWCNLYMSRTDCYTAAISHCRGGTISTRAEQTVTLLLFLIAVEVRSLHEQNRLLHCYYFSLQRWCDLYMSRTDCYTATISHCRGSAISTWTEQTVTLLLFLIAEVVWSLHEQNRSLHCHFFSLQGWCNLYMSRTDCYTATISHCRGGAISTWAEQTVTLLIFLTAGVVQSLHEQNRLLHCYCFSLQGWCDLYMSRTDHNTATFSHYRGGAISTWAEQTVTLLIFLIAGVVRSLHEQNRLLHCYCTETRPYNQGSRLIAGVVRSLHEQNRLLHCCYFSLQGWCDLYTSRTDCYTVTASHYRGGVISTRAEQTVTLLLFLIAGVVLSLHEQNRLLHCYCTETRPYNQGSRLIAGLVRSLHEQNRLLHCYRFSLQGWCDLYTSRTDWYTGTISHCRGGAISTWAEQTVTLVLFLIAGVVRSLHEQNRLLHCYCTETRPYNQGSRLIAGVVQSLHEQNRLLHCYCTETRPYNQWSRLIAGVVRSLHEHNRLLHCYCTETRPYNQGSRLIAGLVRSLHEQNRLLHCYRFSLQGWCDLYTSRTDCYTGTISHCRGGAISTWAEQTVTLVLFLIAGVVRSLHEQNRLLHCYCTETRPYNQGSRLIAGVVRSLHEQNRLLHCYRFSLQGWCDLYTSRTDCYTATASHCRGGVISTWAEQIITLPLFLIAGVVRSLHEQNRLLHCHYFLLQGWCDLYMNRTDCYTVTASHCRGGAISTWTEQTVTLLLLLIAGVVRSLHEQNRLLHCYCFSLQGWCDLYMNRTDCYTVTAQRLDRITRVHVSPRMNSSTIRFPARLYVTAWPPCWCGWVRGVALRGDSEDHRTNVYWNTGQNVDAIQKHGKRGIHTVTGSSLLIFTIRICGR